MLSFYPDDKLDAFCAFMDVQEADVHVWSDNSLTIGNDDRLEYYVTKGKRKYGERIGRKNGFNIYKVEQWEEEMK